MSQPIIILGFMAAGKTSVARELARQLNCQTVDLDNFITTHEKRTPKQIIEQNGEDEFRKIETRILRKVLVDETARVISLGGGAWIKPENRKLLADLGVFTVWLDAPFELCWHRIEPGDQVRPLAPNRKAAINLYAARRPFYALAMMHVKVTENSTAKAIAADIADAVLQQRANT